MSSPEQPMEVPIDRVLQELQASGVLSEKDIQLAAARVSAQILQERLSLLQQELAGVRAELGRR